MRWVHLFGHGRGAHGASLLPGRDQARMRGQVITGDIHGHTRGIWLQCGPGPSGITVHVQVFSALECNELWECVRKCSSVYLRTEQL